MANNISNMLNNRLRLTGMASGLDTESMIQKLMAAERVRVDKVKQQRDVIEWKKDNYREISNLLRSFQDEFFNITKPATNMRSLSSFNVYNATSSSPTVATAKGDAGIIANEHSLEVTQLATASSAKSSGVITKGIVGNVVGNFDITAATNKIVVNYNGVTKEISIPNGTYNNAAEVLGNGSDGKLVQQIQQAFGGKVTVADVGGSLQFSTAQSSDTLTITNQDSSNDILASLGLQSGVSNKMSLSDTMEKFSNKLIAGGLTFDADGKFKLTINNVDIEGSKTDSLSSFISKVNNSTAGVTMSYSAFNDTFTIINKETGAGSITINDNSSNFFAGIKIDAATDITAGTDAAFKIDGVAGTRKTNTVSADGVTYSLLALGTTNIKLSQNTDEIFNKIKAFVEKYNEVIGKITNETNEKYDRKYTPLTDEQKEAMNETDIKNWEERAKTGLLRSDGLLNSISSSMRLALSDTIKDVSGTMASIGITTGGYYEKGKLIIDESKLRAAIQNNPDQVTSIFTKESSISYNETINGTGSRTDRYKENGIAYRLFDILQDNIRTIRDKGGKKGMLLEKAGIAGDITEFKNLLSEEINSKNTLIDTLNDKLYAKENAYYQKFAALEKAMSQMNSQSSWLSQQLGGGQ